MPHVLKVLRLHKADTFADGWKRLCNSSAPKHPLTSIKAFQFSVSLEHSMNMPTISKARNYPPSI